jgi:glycosyltransferase involved in cell wall biosynthesis
MPRRHILFIQTGAFSHINASLEGLLRRTFSDYGLTVFDAREAVYGDPSTPVRRGLRKCVNGLYALKEFGGKLAAGHKKLPHCVNRTSYFFERARRGIRALVGRLRPTFTIQTQSLIDAHTPGTPHFIYTDHASLATLRSPVLLPSDFWPRACLERERSIYPGAAAIFTMSRHVSRCLTEDYGCDPARVVCVGAGPNAPVPDRVTTTPSRYARKRILFVGLDWHRKGGPVLAEAFRRVRVAHPDARLVVVGCSPRLDLPNREVVPRIGVSEVGRYFAESSVFCLPTRLEAFGIVFLEAFAHGLPVLATNVGAIPEFVRDGETGYVVPYGDAGTLAARLTELLADPGKCARLGRRGRELVLRHYNWERVGARMKDRIEQVLGGSPSGQRVA